MQNVSLLFRNRCLPTSHFTHFTIQLTMSCPKHYSARVLLLGYHHNRELISTDLTHYSLDQCSEHSVKYVNQHITG